MSDVLIGVAYFAATLVSSVILIRLRPEWVLSRGAAGEGELAGLTEAERKEYHNGIAPYRHSINVLADKMIRELSRRRLELREQTTDFAFVIGDAAPFIVFAPVVLLVGLPASICIRGAVNSVNTSARARSAIEAELAAAKKEIEELLRSDSNAH